MRSESGISGKYNSTLLFSSRETCYKKPFGAVATESDIEITFPVKESFLAEGVDMIVRLGEKTKKYSLTKIKTENGYDIFYVKFSLKQKGVYFYRFEIAKNGVLFFVGRSYNGKAKIQDWLPEWQLSVYDKNYKTPTIYNGGVVYHIFADRFCYKGPIRYPKYGVLKQWHEDVTIMDEDGVYRANDFFGGNFQGMISKLDYLEALGVNIIYLSPIFEASSNHRYDTGDYSKIDYLLGDEKDFEELIEKAAQKNIAIMLDGVFNHTGSDSLYFNRFGHYPSLGAYQSKQSPYYHWYTFNRFPDDYVCWWGIEVVPTISRTAYDFQDMIAGENGVLKKRTSQGVKGWRLDVVDELSSSFVEKIRSAIKSADPDALVIGEVWEDASTKHSYGEEREYFRGKQLDGVMNYPFRTALIDYVNRAEASTFIESVMTICENYPLQSLNCCMTLLGSHDTIRALNSFIKLDIQMTKEQRKNYRLTEQEYESAVKKLLIASAIQYFLPGLATIYYGDEIGMQGFEDPLNRRTFDESKADKRILEHYKKLGALRKNNREVFSNMFDYIRHEGNVLFIKRHNYLLAANPTQHNYELKQSYYDELSGQTISAVQKMSAAILRLN